MPPDVRDVNGILRAATQWLRWIQAGGAPVQYDAAFSAAVGGYPSGAIVRSVTNPAISYLCTADANTSDPHAGGANWTNMNTAGGALTGTWPTLALAAGAAASNIGILGGSLSGSLPSPDIANNVILPGSPTTTTQAASDSSTKVATTAFVNVWGTANVPFFGSIYNTGNRSITLASQQTYAHGLATKDLAVDVYLLCSGAEGSYATGEVVACPDLWINSSQTHNILASWDATNIYVKVGNTGINLMSSAGAAFTIDPTRWYYFVTAAKHR
ncbi:MAG: hypothetical protein GC190_19305 [Alphaproteobacteria bacterium]|nr:hypothetical protein [Alphaproteobacteria bacterium]